MIIAESPICLEHDDKNAHNRKSSNQYMCYSVRIYFQETPCTKQHGEKYTMENNTNHADCKKSFQPYRTIQRALNKQFAKHDNGMLYCRQKEGAAAGKRHGGATDKKRKLPC
jgi:hypothetical protein